MAEHNDTGNMGEALARRHLEEQGFAIVETNWRRGKHEVDIIAYKEGLMVFAEVKTRHSIDHGNPEEFVDRKKQKAYIRLADAYVTKHQREEEVRFDIISVVVGAEGGRIEHLENAFTAAEVMR